MIDYLQYRLKYGECFVSVFEDLIIPWRKLTLGEFIKFTATLPTQQIYLFAEVEDLIFNTCVLDKTILENIDLLDAGIVSAVAAQVLNISGPNSEEELQQSLLVSRERTSDFIHNLIPIICSVFPAYKPEDLLSMDYDDFMDRAAMVEARLFAIDPRFTGFDIRSANQEKSQLKPVEQIKPKTRTEQKIEKIKEKLGDLKTSSNRVITAGEMASPMLAESTGHELSDKALWQHDALQGMEHIYPEYFKLLKEGKKITPEIIQEVKGSSNDEVKSKHKNYVENLNSGKITPPPAKYLIADKMEAGSKTGLSMKKKKATIKRVK